MIRYTIGSTANTKRKRNDNKRNFHGIQNAKNRSGNFRAHMKYNPKITLWRQS